MLIQGIAHEEISPLLSKPYSFLFLSMGCNAAVATGTGMGTKNNKATPAGAGPPRVLLSKPAPIPPP
jgi:hypothetical protein